MRTLNHFLAVLVWVSITSFTLFEGSKKDPIITRHDKNENDFIKLAKQFEKYMCHLNLPDCEGTIIADQWAVSAAHCSIEIQNKLEAGDKHFVIINGAEIEADQVLIHRKWKKDEAYDIALLHLKNKPKNALNASIYIDEDEVNKIVYIMGKGDKQVIKIIHLLNWAIFKLTLR